MQRCFVDSVISQAPRGFLKDVSLALLPASVDPNDQKKTACYDIDVEVEDPLKSQMSSFLLSTANQQEIATLDNKVRPADITEHQLWIDPTLPLML